jgi:DNA-binding MarR family transcriptional regulator
VNLPGPSPAALTAIRAWYRLDRAFAAVNREWWREHQVTGDQVAIARIVAERDSWPLAELRERLSMHPATLGQILARLEIRGLAAMAVDEADKRRRAVAITPAGRDLLRKLPLIGPVRLRTTSADRAELATLAAAFDRAVELFGLKPWADHPQ